MTKARERGGRGVKGGVKQKERDAGTRAGTIVRGSIAQHARQIYIATTARAAVTRGALLLLLLVAFGKTARCFMARTAAISHVTFVDVELSLTSSRVVRGRGSRAPLFPDDRRKVVSRVHGTPRRRGLDLFAGDTGVPGPE